VTNGLTNLSLTASTLIQANSAKKEISIANGSGVTVLTNDGTGIMGFSGDVPIVLYRNSTVVNDTGSSSASNVVSFAVPANALGTNKSVYVAVEGDYLQNGGTVTNLTIAIIYGATTMWSSVATIPVSSNRRPIIFNFRLYTINATGSQGLAGVFMALTAGAATTGTGPLLLGISPIMDASFEGAIASEDSTASKNLIVQVTWQSAAPACEFKVQRVTAVLE